MEKYIKVWGEYIATFVRIMVIATIVGILCGIVGGGFRISTEFAHETFDKNTFLLFFLPIAGLFINFIYKNLNMKRRDTNTILESLRSYDDIPILMAPLIFISTFITHLYGGSSGKEGAALQMGGAIGSFVGRKLKLKHSEVKIMIMCGMSSLFATFFFTPLASSLFSIEVINVGTFYYGALLPCIWASIVSITISKWFGLTGSCFEKFDVPDFSFKTLFEVTLLVIIASFVAILFCKLMHYTHNFLKKYIPNGYIRIVVGALVIIALTLLVGNYRYNGAGTNYIYEAVNGSALPYDFIFKIIFTVVTLACGFKGGEILPSMFIGATFGNTFGQVLGLDPSFAAAVGLITLFSSVVNCPLAAILLSIEFFGAEGILYYAIAAVLGFIFSGYTGLYDSQKIVYSKLGMDKNSRKVNE